MTPREAKQAGGSVARGGELRGLDADRWNSVSGVVMGILALMQARGNGDFREALECTGDAYLGEATIDSHWGIGLKYDRAMRVRPLERQRVWGTNLHGVALMFARRLVRQQRRGAPSASGGMQPGSASQ